MATHSALPPLIAKASIDKLPRAPGVYYFYDANNKLLYVGKSVNIRQRVLSHFSQDHSNPKDQKINQRLAHIDYRRTPSDFGAQLLESREIKTLFPLFNHRLRRVRKLVRYRVQSNANGYLQVGIETVNTDPDKLAQPFGLHQCGLFRSQKQAKNQLEKLADHYQLCHRLLGLEAGSSNKACFRYQLNKCSGACVGIDPPENYNARLTAALSAYQCQTWPWQDAILIEERDRNDKERVAYHLIDQWQYIAQLDLAEDVYSLGYQPINPQISPQITAPNFQSKTSTKKNQESKDIKCENFDLDTYFILVRFLLNETTLKLNGMVIWPLSRQIAPESIEAD